MFLYKMFYVFYAAAAEAFVHKEEKTIHTQIDVHTIYIYVLFKDY